MDMELPVPLGEVFQYSTVEVVQSIQPENLSILLKWIVDKIQSQNKDDVQQQLDAVQQQVSDLDQQQQALQNQLQEVQQTQEQVQNLNDKVNQIESNIQSQKEATEQLIQQLGDVDSKVKQNSAELDNANTQLQNHQQEIISAKTELMEAKQGLDQAQQEMNAVTEKIQKVENVGKSPSLQSLQRQSSRRDYVDLKATVDGIDNKVREINRAISQQKEELPDLSQLLDTVQQLEAKQEQLQSQGAQFRQALEAMGKGEEVSIQLQPQAIEDDALQRLREQFSDIKNQIRDLKQKNDDTEDKIDQVKERYIVPIERQLNSIQDEQMEAVSQTLVGLQKQINEKAVGDNTVTVGQNLAPDGNEALMQLQKAVESQSEEISVLKNEVVQKDDFENLFQTLQSSKPVDLTNESGVVIPEAVVQSVQQQNDAIIGLTAKLSSVQSEVENQAVLDKVDSLQQQVKTMEDLLAMVPKEGSRRNQRDESNPLKQGSEIAADNIKESYSDQQCSTDAQSNKHIGTKSGVDQTTAASTEQIEKLKDMLEQKQNDLMQIFRELELKQDDVLQREVELIGAVDQTKCMGEELKSQMNGIDQNVGKMQDKVTALALAVASNGSDQGLGDAASVLEEALANKADAYTVQQLKEDMPVQFKKIQDIQDNIDQQVQRLSKEVPLIQKHLQQVQEVAQQPKLQSKDLDVLFQQLQALEMSVSKLLLGQVPSTQQTPSVPVYGAPQSPVKTSSGEKGINGEPGVSQFTTPVDSPRKNAIGNISDGTAGYQMGTPQAQHTGGQDLSPANKNNMNSNDQQGDQTPDGYINISRRESHSKTSPLPSKSSIPHQTTQQPQPSATTSGQPRDLSVTQRLHQLETIISHPQILRQIINARSPDAVEPTIRRLNSDVSSLRRRLAAIETSDGKPQAPGIGLGFNTMHLNGNHAMVASKPILGYRCVACDRPLEKLQDGSGPHVPHDGLPPPIRSQANTNQQKGRSGYPVPAQLSSKHGGQGVANELQSSVAQLINQATKEGVPRTSMNWFQEKHGKPADKRPVDKMGPLLPRGGWRSMPGPPLASDSVLASTVGSISEFKDVLAPIDNQGAKGEK